MRGETMRQLGHVSQMRRGQGSAAGPNSNHDTGTDQPESLMVSRGRKLLHVNRRAMDLTSHREQAESGTICEIHSAPLRELRNAIQSALDQQRAANIWEPFELKRGSRRILVRGIGLADRSSHDDSRIVIVLEDLGLHPERRASERQVKRLSRERRGTAVQRSAEQGGRSRGVRCVLVMVERPDNTSGRN